MKENFEGESGALNDLHTDSSPSLTWKATRDFVLEKGKGVVTTSGGGTALLPIGNLISDNCTITLRAKVYLANGQRGYFRLGFSEKTLFRNYGPIVTIFLEEQRLNVIGGPVPGGDEKGRDSLKYLFDSVGRQTDLRLSDDNDIALSYQTKTGEVVLELNGNEIFRGEINYREAGEVADIANLAFAGFGFQRLADSANTQPAALKSFSLEIKSP